MLNVKRSIKKQRICNVKMLKRSIDMSRDENFLIVMWQIFYFDLKKVSLYILLTHSRYSFKDLPKA